MSCGLYPMPRKTPLRTQIFGKVERDGYTIEKVAIQTYPGFYLAGNLYRPFGPSVTTTKHPGVLVTHGHWENGRMANEERGSISARAITFARMGIVAFTYDMVGYNDTHQVPHTFAGDRKQWLWGVSLFGLQTWNSIRALDFLISLQDVDKARLSITGESGGGTQTMVLGAIDDRLAAVGPCVMVSHSMQGGCLCENAPGLRVDFSNMEVAACAAPKPQIMVGATGDWTKTMMEVEGPAVESVYKLYGKPENLKYVRFNFVHNINKTSRNAVYQAFGKWLLNLPNAETYTEPDYKMEPVEALRVFPDAAGLPKNAIDEPALITKLQQLAISQVEKAKPHDHSSLDSFKKLYEPAWTTTLGLPTVPVTAVVRPTNAADADKNVFRIGREGGRDSIPVRQFEPANGKPVCSVVLVAQEGMQRFLTASGEPGELVKHLQRLGAAVLLVDTFLTGHASNVKIEAERHAPFYAYFDTYNYTNLQERVHDLNTAAQYLRKNYSVPVAIVGFGRAGIWSLLAAPIADGVAVDTNHLDLSSDEALVDDELYVPCLRHMGDFKTAATLAAPHPISLFNVASNFDVAPWIEDVYTAIGDSDKLHISDAPITDDAIYSLITQITLKGKSR